MRCTRRILGTSDHEDVAEVLALDRGDFCAGLTVSASAVFDTWLYVTQESLRRIFRQLTVVVARRAIATGDAGPAIEPLARLVSVDPYYEEGHALLIEASEVLGRPQAAAAAYERYQRILRQELHVEPAFSVSRRFEPEAPGRTAPRDSLVPLRELTLHTVDWDGQEPTILAIHGSTMSAYTYTGLAERLVPEARLVAVDLRGQRIQRQAAERL